jgi:putative SOS response-associated peptidase YedK
MTYGIVQTFNRILPVLINVCQHATIWYTVAMCGRYGFSVRDAKEVYERFDTYNELADLTARYNVAPGQMNPVITSHSPNEISRMFWGLIPHWARDDSFKYKTINARAETVAKLPTFREAFSYTRCIVPATGFFEPDKLNFKKAPFPWHYFQLKDQKIFGFAGIYDVWKDKETGKEIRSYTIITTTPNSLVGKIHDRMPVILNPEDEAMWLDPDIVEPERLLPLLKQYPAEKMEEWRVGEEARNPKNDYPELIKAV